MQIVTASRLARWRAGCARTVADLWHADGENFAHGAFFMAAHMASGCSRRPKLGCAWCWCRSAWRDRVLTERFLVRPLCRRGIDYPLLLTFDFDHVRRNRAHFWIERHHVLDAAGLTGAVASASATFRSAVSDRRNSGDRACSISSSKTYGLIIRRCA
jgi:hypothetical protein